MRGSPTPSPPPAGPLRGADTLGLNLARHVADGEQIVVGIATPAGRPAALGSAVTGGTGPTEAGPATSTAATGPVDLNAATAEQLDALPGVGPVTAAAIVAWRQANGRFASVDQLGDVDGIGPARLEKLRPLVAGVTPGPLPPDRMDLRLVPAALTAWAVTAAGIGWRAGPALACLCTLVAAGWWAATWRWGTRVQPAARRRRRGHRRGGDRCGLRPGGRAARRCRRATIRSSGCSGPTTAVTLTATESPRPAGSSRVMFHADLTAVDDAPAAGRVVVFAPGCPTSPI